ncbi:hypothetical protein GOHSU_22_00040 [Gordonia hirsuta DSM 44140 = NBRC 16056]|uniref:DUF4233 domain-containing protein n=1 Tax=Gordonia hirsuta DSM 44140 = NBRC 16056 TaxID=1121927 RepID=L7L9G5_9ACTN|nr:DUF4233 domain-containing protein [Gordonia hirsuta]GAC57544.1 hypothetical protein GOHSU_22_00040 [Gordonia hirsuta DSM 44140 = NBRC 16056]
MSATPEFSAPATDPWKGFRGINAAVLILEAIVIGLTFPVVATLGDGVTWASGLYLGILCVVMILLSGMQGRSWSLPANLGMQVPVIIGGVLFHWSIAVVGVVFLCVWVYIVYIKRDVQRRIARGMLPGQHPL